MKFGIIGYGGMGAYHAELLGEKAVSVYDIDPVRVELAKMNGLRGHNSLFDFLYNDEYDTVIIATPNDSHFSLAQDALMSGKNVLLEKPATILMTDLDKLIVLAKKLKLQLTVHQNRRFDADFLKVKELIASQKIGKVYRIESNVVAANGLPSEWRKKKEKGGGMVYDWGVHLVDQAVALLGKNIKRISSRLSYVYEEKVDDGFFAELEMRGGLIYCITVDTNSFVSKPRWQIFGYDGSAEISAWGEPMVVYMPKKESYAIEGINAGNGYTKTMAARCSSSVIKEVLPLDDVPRDVFYSHMSEISNIDVQYVLRVLKGILRELPR